MAHRTSLPPQSASAAGLDARAWSFPGAQGSKGSSTTVALGVAVLLHAALGLIDAKRPADLPVEVPIDLEAFVPFDEKAEPAPPPEPEKPKEYTKEFVPSNAPVSSEAIDDTLEGDPDENLEEGFPEDELAAPLLTDGAGDADWSMLSGHGTALGRGGLGRPGSGRGGRARAVSLQARDLSREAIPPHLQPVVDRNFPAAAKLARVDGTVTVSAIIQPDGNPTDVRVVSANPRGRGFGESCTRTVHQGPDWKPKLNRDGRPVAAKVTYTCRFKLPDNLATTTDGPSTGAGANRIWTKPAGG